MTFQNYVCWRPERIQQVMDTEALQPSDDVFLATHHPVKMFREDSPALNSHHAYDEQSFLIDFLAPAEYVFVPVLGSAGTGKSHLVRWLYANIAGTPQRRVLLIPKVGTNLKDIIRRILDLEGMNGPPFDQYRERLERATVFPTEREAASRLLNELAIAVGPDRHDPSRLSVEQAYLVENLPNLLYDPFFREHLLQEGRIVRQLVHHIIGDVGHVDRREERQQFHDEDLPVNVRDEQKAGAAAREIYGVLVTEEDMRQLAVAWLNQNLDAAIAHLLQLGGQDLIQLMLDVREALARQGVELVLLIEDFAKLQGIDRQLLEALLVRPNQGDRQLCRLRVALAATTGYLQQQMETVRDRLSFIVNMDVETGPRSLIAQEDFQAFAARYLNAIRLEPSHLQDWYQQRLADPDNAPDAPNACQDCPYRGECHQGFGSGSGWGLYPFTSTALGRMWQRLNSRVFKPRDLINQVLKHTLETYGEHLRRGEFPPPGLLQHFGRPTLAVHIADEIQRRDPPRQVRRKVLLELWSDGTQVVNLNPVIHQAFNLPGLPDTPPILEPVPVTRVVESIPVPPVTPPGGPSPALQEQLKLLDDWANGALLPQRIANELRNRIYQGIVNHINWDTVPLLRGEFTGPGKAFQAQSMNLANSATRTAVGWLTIPLERDNIQETVLAIQGMLQYDEYKHWNFPNGGRLLRAYANMLDRWSQKVLVELRRTIQPTDDTTAEWDPVPSAVELLAIGARLLGRPNAQDANLAQQVSALFQGLDSIDVENSTRSSAWKELLRVFMRHRDALVNIVESRAPCTKGGFRQIQFIDAAQLVAPLRAVRDDWRPKTVIPGNIKPEFRPIQQFRDAVERLLERAVQEEKERHLVWFAHVAAELGQEPDRPAIVAVARQAMEKAQDAGVFPNNYRTTLPEATDQFQRVQLQICLAAMRRVHDEIDSGKLLLELGRNYQNAMNATTKFLDLFNGFLDVATRRVESNIADQPEAAAIETTQRGITSSMNELVNSLDSLQGVRV